LGAALFYKEGDYIMEWLKSMLARWKVQVSFVAGALVVATTYGQCSFEPPAAEVSENTSAAETVEATTTVEVSATTSTEEVTTSTGEENTPTTTTETTATETTTE
jgi:hypothetical protein